VSPSGKATDFDSVIRRFESSHLSLKYFQIKNMNVRIEFIKNKKELILPTIKLTKSVNGKTGTATFIFIKPILFKDPLFSENNLLGMNLIWENNRIETKDIEIFFKNGNPYFLKATLIFKNSKEWFQFLNFMSYYSKETGISFN
jgi:photosystem II 13kDa protein